MSLDNGSYVHSSWESIITTLAHINMIIRVNYLQWVFYIDIIIINN
jgi:hypothetical protein